MWLVYQRVRPKPFGHRRDPLRCLPHPASYSVAVYAEYSIFFPLAKSPQQQLSCYNRPARNARMTFGR